MCGWRGLPESVATLLALFDDVDDASRAVSAIIAAGLLPAALEMVDREAIRAVEASAYAAGCPMSPLRWSSSSMAPRRASRAMRPGRAICRHGGAREVRQRRR
jgi:FAD/FMN-containing dehydrogenase